MMSMDYPGFPEAGKRRVSCVAGDPGISFYEHLQADGKRPEIVLEGLVQRDVVIADEAMGLVRRCARTSSGNVVCDCNTGEIRMENVFGKVQILIIDDVTRMVG